MCHTSCSNVKQPTQYKSIMCRLYVRKYYSYGITYTEVSIIVVTYILNFFCMFCYKSFTIRFTGKVYTVLCCYTFCTRYALIPWLKCHPISHNQNTVNNTRTYLIFFLRDATVFVWCCPCNYWVVSTRKGVAYITRV